MAYGLLDCDLTCRNMKQKTNSTLIKSTRAGFTLAEVMIALALIGIGLGSAIVAMGTAVGWVKELKNRQYALHTARENMEIIRTLGFRNLPPGTWPYTNVIEGSTSFATEYTIVVSGVNTNIKDLAVKVGWAKTTDPAAINELQLVTTISNSIN